MPNTNSSNQVHVACVPHVPVMALQDRDQNPDLWAAYDARVQAFNEFDPELVIVFGGDHYDNVFLKMAPQFMIGHIAEGIADVGGKSGKLNVPIDIAKSCSRYLVDNGFDIATSHAMLVDHGFTSVLAHFMGELDARPVLPVHINTIAEPRPTLKRCRQLGEAIGAFARTLDKRVALLGSGGLSHQTDFIFPQYDTAPNEELRTYIVHGDDQGKLSRQGWRDRIEKDMRELSDSLVDGSFVAPWINKEWDKKVMDICVSGDLTAFDAWTDEEIVEAAGEGGGEIRQWIAALAAAQQAGAGDIVFDYYSGDSTLAVGLGVVHSAIEEVAA